MTSARSAIASTVVAVSLCSRISSAAAAARALRVCCALRGVDPEMVGALALCRPGVDRFGRLGWRTRIGSRGRPAALLSLAFSGLVDLYLWGPTSRCPATFRVGVCL
ncbi:hypothetical protein AQJ23_17485 [Streptomyces antibioticus]|nr:hypothetical protein AQJ23_17485 [Streptomyces antibioticus]